MTTCLGKSFSFGLPFVYFVNVSQCVCVCVCVCVCAHASFSVGFEDGMWNLTVLIPDHRISFNFLDGMEQRSKKLKGMEIKVVIMQVFIKCFV